MGSSIKILPVTPSLRLLLYSFILILGQFTHLAFSRADGNPGHVCSRFPGGHETQKSPGDNGYYIEVRDVVTKLVVSEFVPSKKYEVSVKSDNYPFKGFSLIAANPSSSFNMETPVGQLEALDTSTAKPTQECPHLMTHKEASDKMSVTVLWYAPENTFVQPCVQFRATVVKTFKEFYMDEDNLTKKICKERSAADYLAVNPQIRQCCACGRANYRLNFVATWDPKTDVSGKTPFDIPVEVFNKPEELVSEAEEDYITPKWQSLIGASHEETFSLWRFDELAPEHLRADVSMNAGKIQPQNIQNFLRENYRSVRTVIRMPDMPNATGFATAQFSVDKVAHLVSFLAFISPSPDWFVGLNSVDLCGTDCLWVERLTKNLYPLDAGTHSGVNFMSNRQPLVQRQQVQDLRFLNQNNSDSPFYERNRSTNPIPPFGTIELVRTAVRDDTCRANNNYNPAFSASDDGSLVNDLSSSTNGVEEVSPGCLMTFWSDWSECVKCSDQKTRTRKIIDNTETCYQNPPTQFENCKNILKGC